MEDAGLNLVRGGDGWAVEEREGRGRCLVATRQLEVIKNEDETKNCTEVRRQG